MPALAAATGPPAVWFLSGNMLDPAVMFAGVPAPEGWATVLCDWLAGPAPTDLPTAAGRLAGQLTRAGPRPLILVGHSAGGVLAMLTQLRVPGRVHGLLLVNTGQDHLPGHRGPRPPGPGPAAVPRPGVGRGHQRQRAHRQRLCHSSPLEDPATVQHALARLAARVTAALDGPPRPA